MRRFKWFLAIVLVWHYGNRAFSQQLALGKYPYMMNKSAVLELNTDNQGLLLPRLTDTIAINSLNPPDGMIVFFVPSKQLLVRTNGYWSALAPSILLNNYWSTSGNITGGLKKIGSTDNFDLSLITNNTDRLRISAAGNVGIGTTSPTQKLDVNGNLRFTGALMPNGNAGALSNILVSSGPGIAPTWQDASSYLSSNAWMQNGNNFTALKTFGTTSNFALPFITNNTERMRITEAGNIGIGINNPSELFQVNGNALFGSTAQGGKIKISNTAGSGSTDIYTDDDVMLRITNSGTGQTGASLQLKNSSQNYLFSFEGRGGFRYYSRNSLAEKFKVEDNGELHSYGTGNNSLNGNLGIGTNNPTERLDVTGNLKFSGALMPNNNSGTSGYILRSSGAGAAPTWVDPATLTTASSGWSLGGNSVPSLQKFGTTTNYDISFITNNTEAMRLTTNNRLGIGISNPAEALDVNGNIRVSGGNRRLVFATPGADPDAVIEHRTYSGSEGNELLVYAGNDNTTAYGPDRIRMVAEEFRLQSFGNASGSLATAETETGTNTRLLIDAEGNTAIGATGFDTSNPEKLLVDAGSTGSYNLIKAKGSINDYLQFNIQNTNSGSIASSDVVATANNGTETSGYIDMGINSSGFTNTSYPIIGGVNTTYLYGTGNDMVIGNATAGKNLRLFTGGYSNSNERMRINASGNVGIGTTNPAAKIDVNGTFKLGSSGSVLSNMIKGTFTVNDYTSFDYNTTRTLYVTVPGATTNASVIINPRTNLPTGFGIGWSRVDGANTVAIGFTNSGTSGSIGNVVFDITIIQ